MKQMRPLGHYLVAIRMLSCYRGLHNHVCNAPLSLKNTCQSIATWSCVLLLSSLNRKKEAPARVKLSNFGDLGGDLCQIS